MPPSLSERVLRGDPRAVARAITLIEDESPLAPALIRALFPHAGRAYIVGITGPPGAGKSTLVDRLAADYRRRGLTVGIVAVDPTSPYSGGAILGDRVRMQDHASDPGVFIRSMATRGQLGGLARATNEAVVVLDAAGRDVVLIETVGVGQDEVDIVRTADVSVIVLVPGAGDEVQALKAGIMEIGDIFVVNKADREGADRTVAAVESTLALNPYGEGQWKPPVLRTEATANKGVSELVDSIGAFRAATTGKQAERRRARASFRLRETLGHRFLQLLEQGVLERGEMERYQDRIARGAADPYSTAARILDRVLVPGKPADQTLTPPRLDHVGIAVENPEAALAFFHEALGLEAGETEDVASQRVRAHFLDAGGTAIELLEATAPDSPISRFLSRRGPGLHHITFRVDDLQSALAQLKASGVRLIDEEPRPGAEGALVAFIHPSSAHGVLVELKQARVAGAGN